MLKMNKLSQLFARLLLLAGFIVFNPALAENPDQVTQSSDRYPDLQFVTAEKHNVSREQVFDGVVEAINKATLKAQTSGQVEAVNFDVDDFVEEGQLLVRIRAEEQTASTAQIEAQVAEARAYFNQTRAEFNRINKIFQQGALSASRRDKARADLSAARARLNAAQAATERTKTQEGYTEIIAPYSGVVAERHIEPGEVASVGMPIMTGMSLDQLRVVAYIPQSQAARIHRYKTARVAVPQASGEEKSYDAIKLTIAPQADPMSHTFKVRVDLPEKIKELYPGMHLKVAFRVGDQDVLLLPRRAVAYRGEVRAVYVKNQQGGLSMSPVRTGAYRDDHVEVLSGVRAGQAIALDPVAAAIALKEEQYALAKSHAENAVSH